MGVNSASIVGGTTWPDGTAKIQLNFAQTPAGSIEQFYVYYVPASQFPTSNGQVQLPSQPWQIVDHVYSNAYDPTAGTTAFGNHIFVGGKGNTVAGPGHVYRTSREPRRAVLSVQGHEYESGDSIGAWHTERPSELGVCPE